MRIEGVDFFINRLGRYSDSLSIAKAQTLSARIWQDYCAGCLDYTLESYQPVSETEPDDSLISALTEHFKATGQGRVRHALRLVLAYRKPLKTKNQVADFLSFMERRGISPQTRVGILSTCKSVRPDSPAFTGHKIRVPPKSVVNDILSRREVNLILECLRTKDSWYYPVFYLWIATGLRNSEIIGLTWDSIDLEQSELKVTKTLRRREDSNTVRDWSDTKNRKHRLVPLTEGVVEVLKHHQEHMQSLGLYEQSGLIFLTKKSRSNLYDLLLERVWKRTLTDCGIRHRKLYSQRHTFLSHTLALGNSPADVAAIAGHRLDELLKTYAKPTGRLKLIDW